MAIDTVKPRSPEIDEGTAQYLERQCVLKQGVDLSSGEILYEITTGSLEGSWDSRISFKVCREDYVIGRNTRPEKVPCKPYIMVECSLHKFFHGQNVFGNPTNFPVLCEMFINLLGEIFTSGDNIYETHERHRMFAEAKHWEVRRVDWAEMFQLSQAAQVEFFRALKNSKFPRRAAKEAKYDTAVHFPGKFTTLRIYGKGAEFKKHDYPRLKFALQAYAYRQAGNKVSGIDYPKIDRRIEALYRLARNRLRAEVQINSDKLHHDFKGRYPLVSEVTDEYLISIYEDQIFKLMREGKSEMETVRTYDRVQARLNILFGSKSANNLFGFWLMMAARGEEVVKQEYSRSRFYANRKSLVDAGVSWNSSDVLVIEQDTALPRDFVPIRNDIRRCVSKVSANSVFNLCPVEQFALRKAA